MHKALNPKAISICTAPSLTWWRVFNRAYGAKGFNGTPNGNARFSPLRDAHSKIIPTMYAASTVKVALMETVLHDIPTPSEGFILTMPPPSKEEREIAGLTFTQPINLADFSTLGLRRLSLTRAKCIDSDKASYANTRSLAEWVHLHHPDIQGIRWTSKQDDSGYAIVLFGDRIKPACIVESVAAKSITEADIQDELIDLLDVLGAGIS